jgi:hypothetical protein
MGGKTVEFDVLPRQLIQSNSSGDFFDASATQVPITDVSTVPLSCVIDTSKSGARVEVSMQDDGTGTGSSIGFGETGITSDLVIVFKRNGVQIATQTSHHQNNVSVEELAAPPSSFSFIDDPPPGVWTYTVEGKGSPTYIEVVSSVLQVREI